MMQPTFTKKLARRVMALAFIISPPNSREWTAAMSAELDHVEGSFTPLSWSIGCLGTALKQLCISILSPGSFGTETEGTMSKFAKISAVALVIASALFLFAPTFQQGLKLTVASWHRSDSAWLSQMAKLGTEAEAKHDAQALAFVAMQLNAGWDDDSKIASKNRAERDKLADEAVQWNADLAWIYYPILARDQYPGWPDARDPNDVGWPARLPNDARWITRLEASDPNNAAVYALAAAFYRPHKLSGLNLKSDRALLADSSQWLSEMNKVFSSQDYNTYVTRKAALDSDIAQRYSLDDPSRVFIGIASYRVQEWFDFNLYAKDFLLQSGEDFEAKGDFARAEQSYWNIFHLAGLMQLRGRSQLESMEGIELQLIAGPKLQSMFEKTHRPSAAYLVAYQTELAERTKADLFSVHRWEDRQAEWRPLEAWIVQLSLLGMAISLALIFLSLARFGIRAVSGRKATAGHRFSALGLAGTALLFASAIAMYFSFAPYAGALRNYFAKPNPENAFPELARFDFLQSLPSAVLGWLEGYTFKIYFWYAIIAAGGTILVWILYRYISRTFRHSAPVQPAN